jgi:hypothetical protein
MAEIMRQEQEEQQFMKLGLSLFLLSPSTSDKTENYD